MQQFRPLRNSSRFKGRVHLDVKTYDFFLCLLPLLSCTILRSVVPVLFYVTHLNIHRSMNIIIHCMNFFDTGDDPIPRDDGMTEWQWQWQMANGNGKYSSQYEHNNTLYELFRYG